jgi:hypothetical protein
MLEMERPTKHCDNIRRGHFTTTHNVGKRSDIDLRRKSMTYVSTAACLMGAFAMIIGAINIMRGSDRSAAGWAGITLGALAVAASQY